MKKILIIHTGGTIAMSEDKKTGEVKPNTENPLHLTLNSLEGVQFYIEDFLNIPSPHMTTNHMVDLANTIDRRVSEKALDGVVITHGTDTLEETAYLLDLILKNTCPVVVTGAMRSSNELGSDGPPNLLSAIRTAMSDGAKNKGVLVVLNDEIHTAKNATKTHTSNIATFQSPQYGPIGIVTKRRVHFHHAPTAREKFRITSLSKKVLLIKAVAGMEKEILDAVCNIQMDGLVIEALGQGNMPPSTVKPIKELVARGIPVVLVSRCFNGIVQDIYGYEGGGRQLKNFGVILTNGLNGQKARIKLMVALEKTTDMDQLQHIFQQ
ncbi:asparaginase [Salipaludibacillus aurantiacus]|uniref:asparaginase n=1 Tax=Salipaludibacillus aurantiacus TaxID=1601833 RepID=A0A1H9PA92_9BACI|nr:asparaginase [Salipaludibacillus aurantiacus]SER45112.1 L-asparaginase [Salipaludibacillus aurantiacus]